MPEEKMSPIPNLTVRKANQLICADYLRQIAKLVEQGSITAFSIDWASDKPKPKGKLAVEAEFLTGPTEAEYLRNVAEIEAEEREKRAREIFVDLSEDMKDHKPCNPDAAKDCAICSPDLS